MQECLYFSIALDSALVRNQHLLSCFARFSFNDRLIEIPLFFDIINDLSGNGIAQFVFNKLVEKNVSFEKMVSITADGATNMTGRLGGITSILKQLVHQHCTRMHLPFKDIHNVWCFAHGLNLITTYFFGTERGECYKGFLRLVFRRP